MTLFGIELTLRKNQMVTSIRSSKDGSATLKDTLPGQSVRVKGFSPTMTKGRREQLMAYGLTPGRRVQLLQRNPVCVIQIDHLELALEGDLAAQVMVEE